MIKLKRNTVTGNGTFLKSHMCNRKCKSGVGRLCNVPNHYKNVNINTILMYDIL